MNEPALRCSDCGYLDGHTPDCNQINLPEHVIIFDCGEGFTFEEPGTRRHQGDEDDNLFYKFIDVRVVKKEIFASYRFASHIAQIVF